MTLCPPRLLSCPPWAGHRYLLILGQCLCILSSGSRHHLVAQPLSGAWRPRLQGWVVTLQPLTCSSISGNVILQHLCVFRLSAPPTCPLPSKAVLYTNRGLTPCARSLALLWGFLHLPPAQLAGTWPTVPWDRCSITVSVDCIQVAVLLCLQLSWRWRGLTASSGVVTRRAWEWALSAPPGSHRSTLPGGDSLVQTTAAVLTRALILLKWEAFLLAGDH